jgi:hypothetical protein
VWPDCVVAPPKGLDLDRQAEGVGDLEAVQVLVIERTEEALDLAVGLGRVMTGCERGARTDEPGLSRVKLLGHLRVRIDVARLARLWW